MEMRAELLKSIWYAFTSLDVEKSGKVSKSQLKVLSHNLYTVLNIPHDPGSLEEHFRDDDDGPVSTQGYMPYLNKFILDKVVEGTFNKNKVDELCWLLSAKKNYRPDPEHNLLQDPEDAFRLWSLFNFLSEDSYPLVLLPEELEYLLKKVCVGMNVELSYVDMEDFISRDAVRQSGITVWLFLEWVGSGRLSRGVDRDCLAVAVQHVYQEMILNVIKEGYLWKKGHVRRNWNERWFRLSSNSLVYYDSEENREEKGCIDLDHNCCVEVLPEREGKRCMLCVKTLTKTYEMSAADSKQRQEWTSAIQTALRLCVEGRGVTLHAELKTQRRQQRAERGRRQVAKEEELHRLHLLQAERDTNLVQLQLLQGAQRQAQADLLEEERRWRQQHEELNRALQQQLQDAEQARASMQDELSQKEEEAERQRRRIRELEETQRCLEEALQEQVRTRRDEEAFCLAQARLLAEEEEKSKALLALQEEHERYIAHTQQEQHELRQEMELKTQALQEAHRQLDKVRSSRQRVDMDIQAAQRKLRQASTSVKHWNIQMNRLMRPIGPGEKRLSTGSSGLPPVPLPKTRDPVLQQLLQKNERDAEGQGHAGREEGADNNRRQEDI